MTTNQTIDGVPREHLSAWAERLERANDGFPGSVPFLQELRALLDADKCTSCDGSGEYIDAIGDWRGYCVCPAGVALNNKPAAQPQGGPVAYVDYSASGGVRWRPWEHGNLSDGAPLCAEQPAPVAVASLEIVGRQCFPSETMKKMHGYRTEPWVDGNIHESPSTPGLYTVEPLVRLSDVDRLNSKP